MRDGKIVAADWFILVPKTNRKGNKKDVESVVEVGERERAQCCCPAFMTYDWVCIDFFSDCLVSWESFSGTPNINRLKKTRFFRSRPVYESNVQLVRLHCVVSLKLKPVIHICKHVARKIHF
ncbi:unnamed protein product [Arctia plantaginis]|uniref:Uncharacterized protein n=1 Tax=Arctia plantaginis TaxID=874455 RepID=A0A8S0YP20_ARCPL|nr:unnamed protein product [Arctia plantaginis]